MTTRTKASSNDKDDSTSSTGDGDDSPSYERRKALKGAAVCQSSTFVVSDRFPIGTYYDAVDRLYEAFGEALDERKLDEAYVYGVRFATFSIENIPKHSHYFRKDYSSLRMKNARRVDDVLKKMESVTERMDAEERVKQRQEKERREEEERRKKQEDEEKQRRRQQEQERLQREYEQEKVKERERERERKMEQSNRSRREMEHSALAKLNALMSRSPQQDRKTQEQQQERDAELLPEKTTISDLGADVSERNHQQRQLEHRGDVLDVDARESGKQQKKQSLSIKQEPSQETAQEPEPLRRELRAQDKPASSSSASLERALRPDERRTIQLLEETISRQEERIEEMQQVKIPALIQEAKTKKASGNRKEALYCIYRKRKWEQAIDTLKGGIFKMETQIMRLQSAAEDRDVVAVMESATQTMQALQVDVRASTVDDINRAMAELAKGVEFDNDLYDEEELLRELDECTTGKKEQTAVSSYDQNICHEMLSLPALPAPADPALSYANMKKTSASSSLPKASLV